MLKNFSEKELSFAMYGLLLGDGSLRRNKIKNHFLVIKHTNKQRFYCKWLKNIFEDCNLEVASYFDCLYKTNLGEYLYSEIKIRVPKNFYFEKCYDTNNKKIISDYVMENINTLGLLFWWLDDGQWHVSFKDNGVKRFGYLNTQSFSYEDNVKIVNMFKSRFDIDLKIHADNSGFYKDRKYSRLYFNATNFRKFYDLVREYLKYIPREFYYKFNMRYIPNKLKESIEYSEKYNLI